MEKLLLHCCCAPCSTSVLERLIDKYDITLFYYNPNITDAKEYYFRLEELKRFLKEVYKDKVNFVEGEYNPERYLETIKGFENSNEGGPRCERCFRLRLEETAREAIKRNIDIFTTTLSVSPYKSYNMLLKVGTEVAEKYGLRYLTKNFREDNGPERTDELCKLYNLYQQNYCGCEFSKLTATDNPENLSL